MDKYPLLLEPAFQDYIWGGQRLRSEYGKQTNLKRIAESWECSVHAHGLTKIANGKYKGWYLRDYIKFNQDVLGPHVKGDRFPLLIKFIDACQDLSIQVHPDDNYALKNENGALGKTEMWYVLSAQQNACLTIGFNTEISAEQVNSSCEDGTIEKFLNRIPIHEDEIYLIKPGTVHAIGKGALILEVQEDSDLTYRMYDYNRMDDCGHKRQLYLDKALDVLDCSQYLIKKQPLRTLRYRNGVAYETLLRCDYFKVERYLFNNDSLTFKQSNNFSFLVLICIEGALYIECDARSYYLTKGMSMFVPCSLIIEIHGKGRLIEVSC